MDVPTWAQDLKQVGLYYEGYVEDIVDLVRQKHLVFADQCIFSVLSNNYMESYCAHVNQNV